MRITNFQNHYSPGARRHVVSIVWEEIDRAPDDIYFQVTAPFTGEPPIEANAFLAGVFPLALLHGEKRIRIDEPVCPMLSEGLRNIHSWWRAWGLAGDKAPAIEAPPARGAVEGRTTATAFLSGGVDSAHMMLENRRRFAPGDAGFAQRAIFLHGFDIGKKKKRGPEAEYFELALRHLRPLVDEFGLELVIASTNLRHLPTVEGFWNKQLHGAVLGAAAHAATAGSSLAYVAATFDIPNMSAWGSHPSIDPNYSTQRVRMVHECVRHSRLDKVRQLTAKPMLFDYLRVCQIRPPDRLNCGQCEKCLRTRLELFVSGVRHAGVFGDTLPVVELVSANVEVHDRYTASCYRDLVAPLRTAGQPRIAAVLEEKLQLFGRTEAAARKPLESGAG